MMPLVKGEPGDDESRPLGKIRNTRHLLFSAAVIISVFLITSAFVTTLLIPAGDFRSAGPNGELAGPANRAAHACLPGAPLSGKRLWNPYAHFNHSDFWFAGASPWRDC